MNREHPDSGRIVTGGDVINDLHDEIAQLRGTRKVLWNLLGECLPVIDALMQIPGDDDSDAHMNGLAGRINDARTAVQAEDLPGATTMSQNTTAMQRAALAAGQATAARQPHRSGCTAGTDEACVQRGCGTNCPAVSPRQGVAYAALPESFLEIPDAQDESGINAYYSREAVLECIDAALASHGQASSQAGEYPALVCDYCGALTPDPWHSSGMLHGKMSKHIHSCDACAARGAARAQDTREPLTPERVKDIVRGAGYDQCGIPDTERAAFINGLRHGEQAHGIKVGQHGEAKP